MGSRTPNKAGKAGSSGARAAGMGQLDQVLLAGVFSSERCQKLFWDAKDRLPPQTTQLELFDYGPAKEFISTILLNPDDLARLRISPKSFLIEGLGEKIRVLLTASIVAQDAEKGPEDFQLALSKSIARVWARFSQQIKAGDFARQKSSKDTDLQARLMKEYLDVQRKMKEFSSFYDEELRKPPCPLKNLRAGAF